jgi:hypothetical protein
MAKLLLYPSFQTTCLMVEGSLSLKRVKWLKHEADHSPPSNAEIKEVYSYESAPTYTFIAQYIIMQNGEQL